MVVKYVQRYKNRNVVAVITDFYCDLYQTGFDLFASGSSRVETEGKFTLVQF